MMEMVYLVLFLNNQSIEVEHPFNTEEQCIAQGKRIISAFKKEHPHSPGWFWCYPGVKS